MDERLELLKSRPGKSPSPGRSVPAPASTDTGFGRYFRATGAGFTYYVHRLRAQAAEWVKGCRRHTRHSRPPADDRQLRIWFDRKGTQRPLTAIGIFAHLQQGDGRSGGLADVPRALDYVDVNAEYTDPCHLHERGALLRLRRSRSCMH